jgi:hypothetical protein
MAFSMPFRTPTPLKSTDLQCGQCAENIFFTSIFSRRQSWPRCLLRWRAYSGGTAGNHAR